MNSLFEKPNFKKPVKYVKDFFYSVYFAKQRACKGYSDYDLWDIDNWFLTVIPDMLTEFNEKTMATPKCIIDDTEKIYKDLPANEISKMAEIRWKSILDSMSFLFKEALDSKRFSDKEEYNRVWLEFALKYGSFETIPDTLVAFNPAFLKTQFPLYEFKNAFRLYAENFNDEEDYREECKNEAFLLFSKWFFHLWQ